MVTLLKIVAWFYSVIPKKAADRLGIILGGMLYLMLASKRHSAGGALKHSFPEWSDQEIKRVIKKMFRTQGLFVAETLRIIGNAKDHPFNMIHCEPGDMKILKDHKASGKGLLVLTAHMNNYELLLNWSAKQFPMSVITKTIYPKRLGDYINNVRASNGITILHRRGSYRDAVRVLRNGGFLGFVIDQNMKKWLGVPVTFFGRPASTTPGLAMMSAHAGVPVLPACLFRDGEGYRLKLYPLIDPPADRKPETLQDMTQLYSAVVESMIREQPEGWIWMHRRWKTQPAKGDRVTRVNGSHYHA